MNRIAQGNSPQDDPKKDTVGTPQPSAVKDVEKKLEEGDFNAVVDKLEEIAENEGDAKPPTTGQ